MEYINFIDISNFKNYLQSLKQNFNGINGIRLYIVYIIEFIFLCSFVYSRFSISLIKILCHLIQVAYLKFPSLYNSKIKFATDILLFD